MELEEGGKIELFGDYFIVGEVGEGLIDLRTRDPTIFEAYIELRNKGPILKTVREIDCVIKHRGLRYNDKIYQVIRNYYTEAYRDGRWERFRVYEIHRIEEGQFNPKNPRKVIHGRDKKFILFDHQKLKDEDVIMNPVETFDEKVNPISKRFHLKFKEQP
ncbi:MAG: hypothetical protein PF542_05730 [Nanoarchaeota archaeon]|jgi:hypothetical protein|nr:hypothetical protein [Nanoarchaeota archaeon]